MPVVAVDEAVVEVVEAEAVTEAVAEAAVAAAVAVAEAVETTTTIWIPPPRMHQGLPGVADDDAASIDC